MESTASDVVCRTYMANLNVQNGFIQLGGLTMNERNSDALDLLMEDHKEVKAMFEKFEQLTDRSVVSKKKWANQICSALMIHTQIEEEIFYPAVRSAIDDDSLVDEAIVEHAAAKKLIAEIQKLEPNDELYDAKVHVLNEQIDHHVSEEEEQMFPKVRQTDIDLDKLGEKIIIRKGQIPKPKST